MRKIDEGLQREEVFGYEELRLMSGKKRALERGAKMRSEEDALGSYTGVCRDGEYEAPVQDADDL